MKGASFSRLMIRLPCRGGDRGIVSLFVMPADWWSSFLVFSPSNMTVFSVAFPSHAEMTFVYQDIIMHGWLGSSHCFVCARF